TWSSCLPVGKASSSAFRSDNHGARAGTYKPSSSMPATDALRSNCFVVARGKLLALCICLPLSRPRRYERTHAARDLRLLFGLEDRLPFLNNVAVRLDPHIA